MEKDLNIKNEETNGKPCADTAPANSSVGVENDTNAVQSVGNADWRTGLGGQFNYDRNAVIRFSESQREVSDLFKSDVLEPLAVWQGMPANQEGIAARILSSVAKNAQLAKTSFDELEKLSILVREFEDQDVIMERLCFKYCNTEVASKMTTSYGVLARKYGLGLAKLIRRCLYDPQQTVNFRSHHWFDGEGHINVKTVYDEAELPGRFWPDDVLVNATKRSWWRPGDDEEPRRDVTSGHLQAYGFSLDLYLMMSCDLDGPGNHLRFLCAYNFTDDTTDGGQSCNWCYGWSGHDRTIYEVMEDFFESEHEAYGPMLVFIPHTDHGHAFMIYWDVSTDCTCRLPCSCVPAHYWVPGSIVHVNMSGNNYGWTSYGACVAKLQQYLGMGMAPAPKTGPRLIAFDGLNKTKIDNSYDAEHYVARDAMVGIKRKAEHLMGFLANKRLCQEPAAAVRRKLEQCENSPTVDLSTMRLYEQQTQKPLNEQLRADALLPPTTFQHFICTTEMKICNAVNLVANSENLVYRSDQLRQMQTQVVNEQMMLMQREIRALTESFAVRSALLHSGFLCARFPPSFKFHSCLSCNFFSLRKFVYRDDQPQVKFLHHRDPQLLRKKMPQVLACEIDPDSVELYCLAYGCSVDVLNQYAIAEELDAAEFTPEHIVGGILLCVDRNGPENVLGEVKYSYILYDPTDLSLELWDHWSVEETVEYTPCEHYLFLGDEEGGSAFHFHMELGWHPTLKFLKPYIVPSSVFLVQHFGSSEALARAWNKLQHIINGNLTFSDLMACAVCSYLYALYWVLFKVDREHTRGFLGVWLMSSAMFVITLTTMLGLRWVLSQVVNLISSALTLP